MHGEGGSLAARDDRATPAAAPSGCPARALFLCIGGVPRTGWAADAGVRTDAAGYILTGPDLLDDGQRPDGWPLDRDPLALETSVPGPVRRRRRAPRLDQARRRARSARARWPSRSRTGGSTSCSETDSPVRA